MTISPWTMEPQARAGARHVIEALLPGADGMPSGLEVGIENELIDRVLAADPKLVPVVLRVCTRAGAESAPAELEPFLAWCGDDAEQVAFAINAAYYMAPAVWEAIGYPGQGRQPIARATPEQVVSDGLIAPVVERGPIYVPTPAAIAAGPGERA